MVNAYDAKEIIFISPSWNISTLKGAIDSFNRDHWLVNHNSKKELNIFHYTTAVGLKEIINNRSIWHSQINHLNDPLELQYGKELVNAHLNSFIIKEKDHHISTILNGIKEFVNSVSEQRFHKIFITSFCEKDNLLSQWRAYANNCRGYNIGLSFDNETMYGSIQDNMDSFLPIKLRKIIYEPELQNRIIKKYFECVTESINSVFSEYGSEYKIVMDSIIEITIVNLLIDMMISMKSIHFKEESEWRLIRVLRPDELDGKIEFNVKNNEIIPYIDTFIFKKNSDKYEFPVNSIRFGPMLDVSKTRNAIELFYNKSINLKKNIKVKDKIDIKDAGFVLRP